ncbi:Pleiotropic regulator 1 [Puccinia graminis f. sp. tritici]|uniref:Pre-mRNA-splicing factor PRP46 n=1 Tax=Puccinia graminis f. sp. tritici TaxID=56615 RepID=A0A5B0QD20_PUCGR|nr:Pleiotropic regulator 1 [Puccinia graminis f. sp. tritici]
MCKLGCDDIHRKNDQTVDEALEVGYRDGKSVPSAVLHQPAGAWTRAKLSKRSSRDRRDQHAFMKLRLGTSRACGRIIKIWDLISGDHKLGLMGHSLAISDFDRHPYLFSFGQDEMLKSCDLELNKIIRYFHDHSSDVYFPSSLYPPFDA